MAEGRRREDEEEELRERRELGGPRRARGRAISSHSAADRNERNKPEHRSSRQQGPPHPDPCQLCINQINTSCRKQKTINESHILLLAFWCSSGHSATRMTGSQLSKEKKNAISHVCVFCKARHPVAVFTVSSGYIEDICLFLSVLGCQGEGEYSTTEPPH